MSKILILKNDRAGDLFTSLKLISTVARDFDNTKIYLSELNVSFGFFFKDYNVKKINFNLSIIDKLCILVDIFKNNYEKIYIISPKSFFFLLPLFFRKTKFYAIVYDGKKRYRPNKLLRKFIYKYKIVSRKKINKYSYRQLQEQLIDDKQILDDNFYNLKIPKANPSIDKLISGKYIFFQFRYKFFEELKWSKKNIIYFLNFLKTKHENVLFCSDIENTIKSNEFKEFFLKNFPYIDLNNNSKHENTTNKNIYYLKELKSVDMFHVIKKSTLCLAKEGIVSHICFFHKVKCHNLFNFKLKDNKDIYHQKISYSEWCKGMNFGFSFLNQDINKTIKKLKNQII
ncbi:MAG: hypothetical protein CMC50_00210 [Flavobacteriaceae bacterium]|nr:hypothetical protein [Flavobacteriaceae bacterium]|tara:strand:- start:4302 stop:5327 length:1026 start_codon:yes stop_codon:yes gene_type:complete